MAPRGGGSSSHRPANPPIPEEDEGDSLMGGSTPATLYSASSSSAAAAAAAAAPQQASTSPFLSVRQPGLTINPLAVPAGVEEEEVLTPLTPHTPSLVKFERGDFKLKHGKRQQYLDSPEATRWQTRVGWWLLFVASVVAAFCLGWYIPSHLLKSSSSASSQSASSTAAFIPSSSSPFSPSSTSAPYSPANARILFPAAPSDLDAPLSAPLANPLSAPQSTDNLPPSNALQNPSEMVGTPPDNVPRTIESPVEVPPWSTSCTGPCCSADPAIVGATSASKSAAVLASYWWSSDLVAGSKFQLKAIRLGTWLGTVAGDQGWETVGCFSTEAKEGDFFVADLVAGTQEMRIKTSDGGLLYLAADDGSTQGEAAASVSVMLQRVPATSDQVILVTSNQLYLAVDASGNLVPAASNEQASPFRVRQLSLAPPFRGVSFTSWLVTEGWMRPDLFVRVPVYIDGLQFRLQSIYTAKWVSVETTRAEHNRGPLSCRKDEPGPWETFHMRTLTKPNAHHLRTLNHTFWTSSSSEGGVILTNAPGPTSTRSEVFRFHFHPSEVNQLMIEAPNGNLLTVDEDDGTLKATTPIASVDRMLGSAAWSGPTVFLLSKVSAVRGEWQLGRHLGQEEAHALLEDHRQTWVTEDDFVALKEAGINAVRIPVGYWIAQGESADYPFTPGGVAHLDRGFDLADAHGMRVFLSLNGAPDSQNGYEHSGSRDGVADWASKPANVDKTVAAVEWLTERYAARRSFAGIGLLNEPLGDGVPLAVLKDYYRRAYGVVRKHSQCAFVSIMARVGEEGSELEDFMTGDEFNNVIQEEHFYNIFDKSRQGAGLQGNLQYLSTERREEISEYQKLGRPLMVGEWSLAVDGYRGMTDAEMRQLADTQLKVYSEAKAGWFFFSHKVGRKDFPRFSFIESVEKGWLVKEDLLRTL